MARASKPQYQWNTRALLLWALVLAAGYSFYEWTGLGTACLFLVVMQLV